ncbi:MAG: hypothetical protein WC182_07760, partial [Bacilli bacterium]
MNNQNKHNSPHNIRRFIEVLNQFLSDKGYVSKLPKATFLAFLDKYPTVFKESTVDELVEGILQNLQQLLISSEEYDIWIRDYKLSYTRNLEGFNTLSKIYQEFNVSQSPLFESEEVGDNALQDLLYLKFELQYRLIQDIPEVMINTLQDFENLADFFRIQKYNQWVFRGQADKKWKLEPSILRNINRETSTIIDL